MSGNNVEIQCSSSAIQITLTSVQHVHISGVSFTGCGSSQLGTNGRSVYLENVSFLESGGITVRNISQGVNITDMVLSVNNYHITVSINDVSNGSVHLNNVVTDAGMIVGAINKSIHFYNVEIRAIHYYYTPITLQNANSISLENMVLSRTSTVTILSARQIVQLSNVSISRSSTIRISSAGQMVQWSNVSISRGNTITISSAGQLNMEDCILQYIQSTSPALILSHISMVTIARCDFSSNVYSLVNSYYYSSSRGGTIYIESSVLNIFNSSFHNNTVYQNGGAIYAVQTNVTINRSIFRNNSANRYRYWYRRYSSRYSYPYGGAIYMSGTNKSLMHCN